MHHNKKYDEKELRSNKMESGSIIKEKGVLEQIKEYYRKNGNIRDLLLFTLAINTGVKLNELLDLNVSDVKGKDCLTIIQAGLEKHIPLTSEIKDLISALTSDMRDDSPLFKSGLGRRIDRTTVYRNFKEVCKEMNLDGDITLASLRKTFGYHYYKTYGDLSMLQWLFNQNSILDTMKYIGLNEDLSSRFKVMNL